MHYVLETCRPSSCEFAWLTGARPWLAVALRCGSILWGARTGARHRVPRLGQYPRRWSPRSRPLPKDPRSRTMPAALTLSCGRLGAQTSCPVHCWQARYRTFEDGALDGVGAIAGWVSSVRMREAHPAGSPAPPLSSFSSEVAHAGSSTAQFSSIDLMELLYNLWGNFRNGRAWPFRRFAVSLTHNRSTRWQRIVKGRPTQHSRLCTRLTFRQRCSQPVR